MKLNILPVLAVLSLTACDELKKNEIYNENNTSVIDGVVYDIDDNPINGLYKIYYPNGHIKMEVESQNGKPHGNGRFYTETGQLLFEGSFSQGVLHGTMINYFPDGSVNNEMQYENGVKNGLHKTYNEDGSPAVEVMFEQDKAISGHAYVKGQKIPLTHEELQELSK